MHKNMSKKQFITLTTISLSVILLGIFIYFIISKIFTEGYILYIDVTEPIYISDLYQRYIYSYSEFKGESLSEISRIPLFFIIFSIFKLLNLSDDGFNKIKILSLITITLGFFLVYISKYLQFLSEKKLNSNKAIISVTLGALFYISNFWFTNRLMHFYLFFTSVTVILTFYYIQVYLYTKNKVKSLKQIIYLLLFLLIFSGTPHSFLIMSFIISVLYLAFILNFRVTLKIKIQKSFGILIFFTTYFISNLYWLLPFLISNATPDAILSTTIFKDLSVNTSLINQLRLMGFVLTDIQSYSLIHPLQNFIAAIPILFLPIFLIINIKKQFKYSIILLFLIALIFSVYNPISKAIYEYLMFESVLNSLGWIFREIDKIAIVIAMVYSVIISVIFYFSKSKTLNILVFVLLSINLINNFLFLNTTLNKYFIPQKIPNDYFIVYEELKKDPELFNVIWYPGTEQPFWSKTRDIEFEFTNLSSPKPTITNRSDNINLVKKLFDDKNIYSIDINKTLNLLGVKYVILRNDENIFEKEKYREIYNNNKSMKKIIQTDLLTVYENIDFKGLVNAYDSKLVTNKGLDAFKELDNLKNNTFLDFTDKPSYIGINTTEYNLFNNSYIDYYINNYANRFIYPAKYSVTQETGNPGEWSFGSLENLTHAETQFIFENIGLYINQFDYLNMVLSSWEGYEILNKQKLNETTNINILFSNHPNIYKSDSNYVYKSIESDFKYIWNIIKSDNIDVTNIDALYLATNLLTEPNLDPHLKVQFYKEDKSVTEVKVLYPQNNGSIESVIKTPNDARYATLQIFTRSTPNQSYEYKIKNLIVKDITNNTKNISQVFIIKNNHCSNNCHLYIRTLISKIGGNYEISLNDVNFVIQTNTNEKSRYNWLYLGNVNNLKDVIQIKLQNNKGFNSISSIVILNQNEFLELNNNVKNPMQNKISSKFNTYQIKVEKINPTTYKIINNKKIDNPIVLTLNLPYNKDWILNNQTPSVINGYVNGWYFDSLEEGEYIVSFKPQKYLYIGAIITILSTFSIIAVHYLISSKKISLGERSDHG